MKVFLVGFMGAGKTTLGKQLAQQLGYTFVDTDQLIEKHLQTSITDYFEKEGEVAFRNIETQILHTLATTENTVIATGGGLPCYNNNMAWMNGHGITIYIKQPIEELANRLINQKNNRPLIKTVQNHALPAHIKGLLQIREPYYLESKFVILGHVATPQTVINTIFS
jgi:shikimate kinase